MATAKIKFDKKDGLHKIVLPSDFRSLSNDDLSDFRIFDSKKKEVPYYIDTNSNLSQTNQFVAYKTVSKTVVPNKNTVLIFENPKPTQTLQNHIALAEAQTTKNGSDW